jgi:hypothetical protein
MRGRGAWTVHRARIAAALAAALVALPAPGEGPAAPEPAASDAAPGLATPPGKAAVTLSLLMGLAVASSDQVDGQRERTPELELLALVSPGHLDLGLGGGGSLTGDVHRWWIGLLGGVGTEAGPSARVDLLGELGFESFTMTEGAAEFAPGHSLRGGKATLGHFGARLQLALRAPPYAVGLALFARRTFGTTTTSYTEENCSLFGGCTETTTPIRYGGFEGGLSLVFGGMAP